MPLDELPSMLSTLARRPYEWPYVAQYLSLADLGRLRAVSTTCRDAVTPGMMERAALDLIRQEEGAAVAPSDLHDFRFHPATREWVEAGRYATACVASLHLARTETLAGHVGTREEQIELPGSTHLLDLMPQARDGQIIVWYIDPDSRRSQRLTVSSRPWAPLQLPAGLVPFRNSLNSTGVARQFLVPQAGWGVLGNLQHELFLYRADTGELASLPLRGQQTGILIAACSSSGRFVAAIEYGIDSSCTVDCYDRERDRMYARYRFADCMVHQLSVTNDGRVFGAGFQGDFLILPSGEVEAFRHDCHVELADSTKNTYLCSPDEQFLVRSDMRAGRNIGDLILEDGERQIRLPRGAAPEPPFGAHALRLAFSILNALVAVVYEDGLIRIFDLGRDVAGEARVLATAGIPIEQPLREAAIRFDGFNVVQAIFPHRTAQGARLSQHTLSLAQGGTA